MRYRFVETYFYRLFKNGCMQGARGHEECGVLFRAPQRRMMRATQQAAVFQQAAQA
jgi:hypothetical protein